MRHETSKFHMPALRSRWKHHKELSFSFSKLRYGVFGFNPRKIRQQLTNWMKLNKIDELWNCANSLLSEFSVCCHPEILLLWQRDVTTSPLYSMVMLWCALTMTSLKILSNTFIEILQEHPTTVFCKIPVRRSKNSRKVSIAWGRLNISRWPFHSRTIFEALI